MKSNPIRMGALAPKLSEQIEGLSTHYDKDAEAITRLAIRGLLTDAEVSRVRTRLLKGIEKSLKNG